MTQRDLDEWDAEIEAEFQRAVRATKAAGRRKRRNRFMGCPMSFLIDVCRRVPGRSAVPVVVAILIYHRTIVCRSQTVTLPGALLTELGVDRPQKSRALALLSRVGLIRIEQSGAGQTAKVTLLRSG
jgi:hypothetical protein